MSKNGTIASKALLGFGLFVVVAVAAVGSAWADDGVADRRRPAASPAAPATSPAAAGIEDLIRGLHAADYPSRVKSQGRLAALGESARTALERIVANEGDPEVVDQAKTLIGRLDRAAPIRADAGHAPPPRRAGLGGDRRNRRPGEGLLRRGGRALARRREPPRVTVDCDAAPFWSAVQQLCGQAGLRVTSSSPGAPVQLAIGKATEPPGPFAVAGPFLLKVKRVERTRGIAFDGPRDLNAATGMRISLFCWAEPKMAAATGGMWSIRQLDEVVTDAGQALDPKPSLGYAGGGGAIGATGNEGTLTYRADVPRARLTRLRATARFTLPGKTQTFDVDNAMRTGRVERQIGGYTFVLKEVSRVVEGRYAYTVEVGPGDHSPDEFQGLLQTLQRKSARLVDAQGQTLRMVGGTASMSPAAYTATQQVTDDLGNGKKAGEPARFVWDVPVDSTTLTLPVESQLPLP